MGQFHSPYLVVKTISLTAAGENKSVNSQQKVAEKVSIYGTFSVAKKKENKQKILCAHLDFSNFTIPLVLVTVE